METIKSKNGVPIRLPDERWFHITEEHSEMAGYYFDVLEALEEPEVIYEGNAGELFAVKELEKDKYIVVIYKESTEKDGFIITAYLTRRKAQLDRRRKLWQRQK